MAVPASKHRSHRRSCSLVTRSSDNVAVVPPFVDMSYAAVEIEKRIIEEETRQYELKAKLAALGVARSQLISDGHDSCKHADSLIKLVDGDSDDERCGASVEYASADDDDYEHTGNVASMSSSRSSLMGLHSLSSVMKPGDPACIDEFLREAGYRIESSDDEYDTEGDNSDDDCACGDDCLLAEHEVPLPAREADIRLLEKTIDTYSSLANRCEQSTVRSHMLRPVSVHNPRGFYEFAEMTRRLSEAVRRGDTVVNLVYPNNTMPSAALMDLLQRAVCHVPKSRYYDQRLVMVRKRVRPYGCPCEILGGCSCFGRGLSRIQLEVDWTDRVHASPRSGSNIAGR